MRYILLFTNEDAPRLWSECGGAARLAGERGPIPSIFFKDACILYSLDSFETLS
jgi:hypothetical protein